MKIKIRDYENKALVSVDGEGVKAEETTIKKVLIPNHYACENNPNSLDLEKMNKEGFEVLLLLQNFSDKQLIIEEYGINKEDDFIIIVI